jgi:hypothetical protein
VHYRADLFVPHVEHSVTKLLAHLVGIVPEPVPPHLPLGLPLYPFLYLSPGLPFLKQSLLDGLLYNGFLNLYLHGVLYFTYRI